MKNNRTLPALGAGLWILGLILAIVGMNIRAAAGQWMAVIGNICFLTGLGLEGVYWMKRRNEKEKEKEKETTGEE